MKQLNSIFQSHYNNLMQITVTQQLKETVLNLVQQSKINPVDRNKVVRTISNLNNLNTLQIYVTNSMLKYQGLGTIN